MKFIEEFELKDGNTVEVNFEGYYEFTPGYFSGLPENCYPDDEEFALNCVTELTKLDLFMEQIAELIDLVDDFVLSKEAYTMVKEGICEEDL